MDRDPFDAVPDPDSDPLLKFYMLEMRNNVELLFHTNASHIVLFFLSAS